MKVKQAIEPLHLEIKIVRTERICQTCRIMVMENCFSEEMQNNEQTNVKE